MNHSRLTDYEADDVLVVAEREKLRALGGELRSRIVLLLRERAASVTELAEALGVPKSTVAHHVRVLERAGLIRVVATRRVRAITEKFYGRVARLFLLSEDETSAGAPGEAAAAATMLRLGADEILRLCAEEIPGARVDPELMTSALPHARLRPVDARLLIGRLRKLLADFQALDNPDGQLFGFAAALYPTRAALPERAEDG